MCTRNIHSNGVLLLTGLVVLVDDEYDLDDESLDNE